MAGSKNIEKVNKCRILTLTLSKKNLETLKSLATKSMFVYKIMEAFISFILRLNIHFSSIACIDNPYGDQ